MISQTQKIKIHKNMVFTDRDLLNYLSTVFKFNKLEDEILATITYKRGFDKLNNEDTLIAFPYKHNLETEISKSPRYLHIISLGSYLNKYIDQDDPVDSILIHSINQNNVLLHPLQVKYLGRGKYKNVTTETFIDFLKKYSKLPDTKITFVIVLEGTVIINLFKVADWLENNYFPYREVTIINADFRSGDMGFYQLKPFHPFGLIMSKKEILSRRDLPKITLLKI